MRTCWFGCRSPGLWWCLSGDHQWHGEGKVLVPGLGSALRTCQSFFLLPTQGRSCSPARGLGRRGPGHGQRWDRDLDPASSPRSPVLSSPAQSLSLMDIPEVGGLSASPSEC